MNEKEKVFYDECLVFLDHFGVDYSKEVIELTSGGNSCIMVATEWAKSFPGVSINSVAIYVAEKMDKKTVYISDYEYLDEE